MTNSNSKQVLWFSADYYRSLTDDNLFKDHAINCRCCFREIQDPITEENIVKDFHRKSFEKWTNVAMMSRNPNASMHICANCDLLLQAFIDFKDIAAGTPARYSVFLDRVDEEIQQQAPSAEVVDLTADSDIDEQEIEPETSGIEEQQLADGSENEETPTSSSAVSCDFYHFVNFLF